MNKIFPKPPIVMQINFKNMQSKKEMLPWKFIGKIKV